MTHSFRIIVATESISCCIIICAGAFRHDTIKMMNLQNRIREDEFHERLVKYSHQHKAMKSSVQTYDAGVNVIAQGLLHTSLQDI